MALHNKNYVAIVKEQKMVKKKFDGNTGSGAAIRIRVFKLRDTYDNSGINHYGY
jgi:hypothetical protein